MADGEKAPDPREACDPGEFIARLQALKDWSGLTYRDLSARAAAVGDVLPRSTVANMLTRTTVPREELLTAFVRACGVGPEALDSWLAVRKELAVRGRAEPAPGRCAGPEQPDREADGRPGGEPGDLLGRVGGTPPGGAADHGPGAGPADDGAVDGSLWWGARPLVPLICVLALVVAVTTVLSFMRGGGERHPESAESAEPVGPGAGPVRIRAVHSGLCLNERPGERNGQVYQVPCAEADTPRYSLVQLAGGLWRLRTDHPDFGPGCSGIPVDAGEPVGAPLVDQECGKRGPREEFRIDPYGDTRVRGYRMRSVHSGLCVEVRAGDDEPWTDVVQNPCADEAGGQLFSFDPRPR
ncbi:helix-turn-helix domain-containing protein [Streptomyces sp. SP18CS02]|uniref:helix-turn-helix domain-containing protein n=1 Tax=Streptomyces sp. SP18CS02 TaxID=3002531 RepID=UPI002E7625BF|nr:helix-turn-helix domain-containing protein [Streptomyces sp. SP18CS02]MEE1757123.1 hypothetical protein [Streptomyces sp. SP18CS02]